MEHFKQLTSEELYKLKNAISWITILIAGADGKIDARETEWAEKLATIRSYSLPEELKEFYHLVGEDFYIRLHNLIEELPEETTERTSILTENLGSLNPILAKIDNSVGSILYKSYLSFAKHVAKASGGFLGFFSVSAEEQKLLSLEMIHPIINEDEE